MIVEGKGLEQNKKETKIIKRVGGIMPLFLTFIHTKQSYILSLSGTESADLLLSREAMKIHTGRRETKNI